MHPGLSEWYNVGLWKEQNAIQPAFCIAFIPLWYTLRHNIWGIFLVWALYLLTNLSWYAARCICMLSRRETATILI